MRLRSTPAETRATASSPVFFGAIIVTILLTFVSALPAYAGTQSNQTQTQLQTASVTDGFNPGMIVSDEFFYNTNTMSVNDIQNFLNTQGKSCTQTSSRLCLKNYKENTPPLRSADSYCKANFVGANNDSAASIIYKVSKACGINPQVLLITLEKEQSLITQSRTAATLGRALGFGCPDNVGGWCDPKYSGFANQVYSAARQLQIYAAKPTSYAHKAKAWNNVRYSPTASCGSGAVYIQNQATASLYNYTPYQPNAAALKADTGTGDSCSSYGNRNFYILYNKWFASGGNTTSVSNEIGLTWLVRDDYIDVGATFNSTESNVEYSFQEYDVTNQSWSQIANWSTGNWASWKSTPGPYWLHVEVRSASSKAVLSTKTIAFNYTAGTTALTKAEYQVTDSGVQLSMTSNSSKAKMFTSIYNVNTGKWDRKFTHTAKSPTATWYPSGGTYWVHQELLTSDDRLVEARTTSLNIAADAPWVANASNLGLSWVTKDEYLDVTLNATTTTPKNLEYTFKQYDVATGKWSMISDWSTASTVSWKSITGTYWLYGEVRNKTSKESLGSKTVAFNYTPGTTKLTTNDLKVTSKGVELTMKSNSSKAQMVTSIYNVNTGVWERSFNHTAANPTATWYPNPGTYWVYNQLFTSDKRLADTKITTKTFDMSHPWVATVDNVGLTWVVRDEHLDVGLGYNTLTPNNLEFSFQQYDVAAGKWTTIANWTTGNWASWKSTPGVYWLHAEVRNKISKEVLETRTIAFNYAAGSLALKTAGATATTSGIELSMASTNGKGKLTAQIYDVASGKWTESFSFTTAKPTQIWKPAAGAYWINYTLQSSDGRTIANRTVSYGVGSDAAWLK